MRQGVDVAHGDNGSTSSFVQEGIEVDLAAPAAAADHADGDAFARRVFGPRDAAGNTSGAAQQAEAFLRKLRREV
jgi:hypothetical protein